MVTEAIGTNPLIRTIISDGEVEQLTSHYKGEDEGRERALAYLRPLVQNWRENGKLRTDINSELVATTLRAVTMITLHRDDIGEDHYAETRNLLIELVASGLVEDNQ